MYVTSSRWITFDRPKYKCRRYVRCKCGEAAEYESGGFDFNFLGFTGMSRNRYKCLECGKLADRFDYFVVGVQHVCDS